MSDSNDFKFTGVVPEHLDVFREIGNIGAGNAATALAELLDKRIDMGVPSASLVPFNNITDILGGPENLVAGILISMSGDLKGYILLVLDTSDALGILSVSMGKSFDGKTLFDLEPEDSAKLIKIATVLIGAYVGAIASLTALNIDTTEAELSLDMAAAIMSVPVIEYGKIGDEVLLLVTEFYDSVRTLAGHFFLIPDLQSYYVLLKSLGIVE